MYIILYVPFSVFVRFFLTFLCGMCYSGEFVVHVFSVGNKMKDFVVKVPYL